MVSWFSTHLYPACLLACLPVCLSVSLSIYVCHQFFSKWFLVFGGFFHFLAGSYESGHNGYSETQSDFFGKILISHFWRTLE